MDSSTEIFWINLEVKRGNNQVFVMLYQKQHKLLYHFIRKFIQDENTIQDILHDAFYSLWQSRHRLTCRYPIEGYLFKIVRNLVYQSLRKELNVTTVSLEVNNKLHTTETHPCTETLYIEKEYSLILRDAIESLPPQRQKIFKLAREENNSYEHIANMLSISRQTVKEHMSLAMKTIVEYFQKEHGILLKSLIITFLHTLINM